MSRPKITVESLHKEKSSTLDTMPIGIYVIKDGEKERIVALNYSGFGNNIVKKVALFLDSDNFTWSDSLEKYIVIDKPVTITIKLNQ